jgi:hypothetical protein
METDVPTTHEINLPLQTFDGSLGRRIIETHIWAVREGLRGASAYDLFDGYCQRLVLHGVPLWRAHAAMETLHPQGAATVIRGVAISTRSTPNNMRAVILPARTG